MTAMGLISIFLIATVACSYATVTTVAFTHSIAATRGHSNSVANRESVHADRFRFYAIPSAAEVRSGRSFPSLLRTQNNDDEVHPDYSNEETLLKIHLMTRSGVSVDDAMEALSKFCQSFPFAAVLPVQPMQYLPTKDHGVEIKFLRKKTSTKSGVDGGIRFFLSKISHDDDDVSTHEALQSRNVSDDANYGVIEIVAKRNSLGQTVAKIMSEKLVITAFTKALVQMDDTASAPTSSSRSSLEGKVSVTSIFHKWM